MKRREPRARAPGTRARAPGTPREPREPREPHREPREPHREPNRKFRREPNWTCESPGNPCESPGKAARAPETLREPRERILPISFAMWFAWFGNPFADLVKSFADLGEAICVNHPYQLERGVIKPLAAHNTHVDFLAQEIFHPSSV